MKKDTETGTKSNPKVTEKSSAVSVEFARLCEIMDTTPFKRAPYRGLLSDVAEKLGFKGGQRSLAKAIRQTRNVEAMIAVHEAIEAIKRRLHGALNNAHKGDKE